MAEPLPAGGRDTVMNADGSLKPPYDTKYPAYTAMHDAFFKYDVSAFADADGVSDYSYDYWKGWKAGNVQTFDAVHETLAEMAKAKYTTGKFPDHMGERIISYRGEDKPKPSAKTMAANAKRWRNLYNTVNKVYQASRS
jgi:2',3'-cyclic-nucleotide 2'-phosphodiesterase (5'-nucleotidase family)